MDEEKTATNLVNLDIFRFDGHQIQAYVFLPKQTNGLPEKWNSYEKEVILSTFLKHCSHSNGRRFFTEEPRSGDIILTGLAGLEFAGTQHNMSGSAIGPQFVIG